MRYFAELSYQGSQYCGWQKQPSSPSVQASIEEHLSTIVQKETPIVGCGRTDTGVHARLYYAHFDVEPTLPPNCLHRLNKLLPEDIAIHRILPLSDTAHARFDAHHRAYEYHLHFQKTPFLNNLSYLYPYSQRPDKNKMAAASALLLQYEAFFPFCKSNSDAQTMNCQLTEARWDFTDEGHWVFHIAANRFLRGMVRLIVGMCLNVGLDKVSLEEVTTALDKQERLNKNWSVAPEGLFLTDIRYPYLKRG